MTPNDNIPARGKSRKSISTYPLSEDESLFRESVREFAAREIKPLVREMDDQAKMPRPSSIGCSSSG
jgi:hypothetical protein